MISDHIKPCPKCGSPLFDEQSCVLCDGLPEDYVRDPNWVEKAFPSAQIDLKRYPSTTAPDRLPVELSP